MISREEGQSTVAGRVSMVIPAFNCAGTIASAIESCLAQDYEDLEVIVVNDGSTDRTREVLESFGTRIKVVHQQRNGGLASARNTGQRAATGEYLAWMDGDDLAMPTRARLQACVLATQPEIGLVSSDFSAFMTAEVDFESSHLASYYDAISRVGGVEAAYPVSVSPVEVGSRAVAVRTGDVYEALVWGNFVHPPTVMVRRSLLEEVGYADERLRYSSDYDLIVRLARRTRFGFIEAPLLRYRRSIGQMSHGAGARMELETASILERLRREDPVIDSRLRSVFRTRLAESHIQAAESIGTSDRRRALDLLVRGLRQKVLAGPALLALGRIVASPGLIQSVKHGLRAVGIRWAMLAWLAFGSDGLDLLSLGVELL